MMYSECEKPGCTEMSDRTYNDGNGNSLKLCQQHYYNLVSGENFRATMDSLYTQSMDEMYGDGSAHDGCTNCGLCIDCGDCDCR
jgi:hypothetical protein